MVSMTLICDRCGAICKEDHNSTALYTLERYGEALDLCSECNKALNDFMNMQKSVEGNDHE